MYAFSSLDASRNSALSKLKTTALLTGLILVLEIIGGWISHSLSLLSDAGHVFTDLLSLLFVAVSMTLAKKWKSPEKTFGYYRMEILAALLNGGLLLLIAFEIIWEAVQRVFNPQPILLNIMLPIAFLGLLVNLISAFLLHHHKEHLATRSAYYHLLSDSLSSIGVVFAGIWIWKTQWLWMDPLVSVLIALLIFYGAYKVLYEAVNILLEATPKHLSSEKIRKSILEIQGVESVHDLHVWTITSGFYAASAHLQVKPNNMQFSQSILEQVSTQLKEKFGINHTTFQIENLIENEPSCEGCSSLP